MENRTYGYARVSTKEQNLDRQLLALDRLHFLLPIHLFCRLYDVRSQGHTLLLDPFQFLRGELTPQAKDKLALAHAVELAKRYAAHIVRLVYPDADSEWQIEKSPHQIEILPHEIEILEQGPLSFLSYLDRLHFLLRWKQRI